MEFCFITIVLLAAVSASEIPREEESLGPVALDIIEGTTNFSASILLQSRSSSGGRASNYIISPFVLSYNLGMLRACSSGEARQEYNKLPMFHHTEQQLQNVFQEWNGVIEETLYQRDIPSGLIASTRMVIQYNIPFKNNFFNSNPMTYNFDVFAVDLINQSELARTVINRVFKRDTRGLIPNILLPDDVTNQTEWIGSSTAYFNAVWKYQFRTLANGTREFRLQDGTLVQVPMMVKTNIVSNHILCRRGQPSRAICGNQSIPDIIEVPFLNEAYKMIILSTNEAVPSLETIESKLATDLKKWKSAMQSNYLTLTMPRFELNHKIDLKQTLSGYGLHSLINSSPSAFGALTEKNLTTTKFFHAANVKIMEDGVTTSSSSLPRPAYKRINLHGFAENHHTINRPFLFLFEHVKTNTILLLGRVMDPTTQR